MSTVSEAVSAFADKKGIALLAEIKTHGWRNFALASHEHAYTLSGIDLADLSIAGIDPASVDFTFSSWRRAVVFHVCFGGCRFTDANFDNAHFHSVWFDRCNLEHASFHRCTFHDCTFRDCDLDAARFEDCLHVGTCARDTSLTNLRLIGARFISCSLGDATVSLYRTEDSNIVNSRYNNRSRRFARACPPVNRHGGRVVYRTRVSTIMRGDRMTTYDPGRTYTTDLFDSDPNNECSFGIYAATLDWLKREALVRGYGDDANTVVAAYVRDGDWTITAKGAIRCRRLRILYTVDDVNAEHLNPLWKQGKTVVLANADPIALEECDADAGKTD